MRPGYMFQGLAFGLRILGGRVGPGFRFHRVKWGFWISLCGLPSSLNANDLAPRVISGFLLAGVDPPIAL